MLYCAPYWAKLVIYFNEIRSYVTLTDIIRLTKTDADKIPHNCSVLITTLFFAHLLLKETISVWMWPRMTFGTREKSHISSCIQSLVSAQKGRRGSAGSRCHVTFGGTRACQANSPDSGGPSILRVTHKR